MSQVSALKAKATSSDQTFPSAIRPIPHSAKLSPPLFTSLLELDDEPVSSRSAASSLVDDCYKSLAEKSPILITKPF